jgi:hypothetical protein
MNYLTLLLYALVTFRLAELFVVDDGPFEIFVTLRGWFNRAPLDSKGIRRTIAEALQCVHCTGIWLALALTFTLPYTSPLDFFIWFLAIAGVQSLLACNLGRTKS